MFCTMWSLYANFTIEVFPDVIRIPDIKRLICKAYLDCGTLQTSLISEQ